MTDSNIAHDVAQLWLDEALAATCSGYGFERLVEHFPRCRAQLTTIAGYMSPWMPASHERWATALHEYAYLLTAFAVQHCDLRVRSDRRELLPDIATNTRPTDILYAALERGARSASFLVTTHARGSRAWVPFERSLAEYWLDNDCNDLCFTRQRIAVTPTSDDCVKALALRCLPLRDIAFHAVESGASVEPETLEQWLFRRAA